MPSPEADPAGVAARRAALQMLDSVLRQGRTLEAAAEGKPCPPTFRDALETQRVCDAVLTSARNRGCEQKV